MKYVSLNEKASDAKLLSTIVHECRHSEQTPVHDHTYSVYDSVCEVRAMEADAMAHECAAVYQMRKAEPETYEAFCERHGGIMKAYETSFEARKDPAAAKTKRLRLGMIMRNTLNCMIARPLNLWRWVLFMQGRIKRKYRQRKWLKMSAMSNPNFLPRRALRPFRKNGKGRG